MQENEGMGELDRIQAACTEVAEWYFSIASLDGEKLTDEQVYGIVDIVSERRDIPVEQIKLGLMGAGIAAFHHTAMAQKVGANV